MNSNDVKNLVLTDTVQDNGFLDYCYYVVRQHQLHSSMKNLKKNNKQQVCEVSDKSSATSGENLCNCSNNLVLASSLCFENLENIMCDKNELSSEECMVAGTVTPVQESTTREKFDSCASQNFYGKKDCLKVITTDSEPIYIQGFTDSHQAVSSERGINCDGQESFYVRGMPEDLALLSAYLYVQDGTALLFPSDVVVVKLSQKN